MPLPLRRPQTESRSAAVRENTTAAGSCHRPRHPSVLAIRGQPRGTAEEARRRGRVDQLLSSVRQPLGQAWATVATRKAESKAGLEHPTRGAPGQNRRTSQSQNLSLGTFGKVLGALATAVCRRRTYWGRPAGELKDTEGSKVIRMIVVEFGLGRILSTAYLFTGDVALGPRELYRVKAALSQ